MINKELDDERKELLDLAERVGYLDPLRATASFKDEESTDGGNVFQSRSSLQPGRSSLVLELPRDLNSLTMQRLPEVSTFARTTKHDSKSPFKTLKIKKFLNARGSQGDTQEERSAFSKKRGSQQSANHASINLLGKAAT